MTKLLLVLAFLVVMAAGGVVGVAVDRQLPKPVPPAPRPHNPRSGPAYPKVTPEQKAKIDEIWAPILKEGRESRFSQRRALDVKRSQEIQAMLTPEEKVKYDAIQANYRADVKKLEDAFQDTIKNAESQTRAILNDAQRKQYDEWALHQARRGGGPPGRGGPGRGGPMRGNRDRSRPTTIPATAPANPLTSAS